MVTSLKTSLHQPTPDGKQKVDPDQARDMRVEFAKYCQKQDWRLTPLHPGTKQPKFKGWQERPDPTTSQAVKWAGDKNNYNHALRCGTISGMIVIDLDANKTTGELPELPDFLTDQTIEVRTGGGGRHLYYALPPDYVEGTIKGGRVPGMTIDVQSDGRLAIGPGSIHPDTGNAYTFAPGHDPDSMDAAPCPVSELCAWIDRHRETDRKIKRLKRRPQVTPRPKHSSSVTDEFTEVYLSKVLTDELSALATTGEGGRNHALNECAFNLARFPWDDPAAIEDQIAQAARDAGLPEDEIQKTLHSGWTDGLQAEPRQAPPATVRPATTPKAVKQKEDAALIIAEDPEPMRFAESLLTKYKAKDGTLLLRRFMGEWWRYNGAAYERVPDETLSTTTFEHLDQCATWKRHKDEERLVKIKPTRSMVGETLAAAPACGALVDKPEMPCWLEGKGADPGNIIVMQNGLLNLRTKTMSPSTPRFFSENLVPYDYDPKAPAPKAWGAFLKQLWPDDPQAWELLQEWMGYCLTADTRQQKIMMLVGPKRSGKGTIAEIMARMIGKQNTCSPTLAGLGTHFGLQNLIGRRLAVIGDARLSGRSDVAVVAERLLSISGEDGITIDRKHREAVTVQLPTRFVLLSNELPRLTDASGALASRFVMLTLTESFFGREDLGLRAKLLAELPGILNWAIQGRDRLKKRGYFVMPESSKDAVTELEDLGSPIGAFLRDRCVVAPGKRILRTSLYEDWKGWCKEQGRDHVGTAATFGRDLRAAVPGLKTTQPRVGGVQMRFYEGVDLK
jgi:putative DNA primase/helicase